MKWAARARVCVRARIKGWKVLRMRKGSVIDRGGAGVFKRQVFYSDINSRLQSSNMMHVGLMDRGDNPSGEVDKCTDINLSIPGTSLYDINIGVRWCLPQRAVPVPVCFFCFLSWSRLRWNCDDIITSGRLAKATHYRTFRSMLNKLGDTIVQTERRKTEKSKRRYSREVQVMPWCLCGGKKLQVVGYCSAVPSDR